MRVGQVEVVPTKMSSINSDCDCDLRNMGRVNRREDVLFLEVLIHLWIKADKLWEGLNYL